MDQGIVRELEQFAPSSFPGQPSGQNSSLV